MSRNEIQENAKKTATSTLLLKIYKTLLSDFILRLSEYKKLRVENFLLKMNMHNRKAHSLAMRLRL